MRAFSFSLIELSILSSITDFCILPLSDQTMVTAISRRIDEDAGEIFQLLLQLMYIRSEPWAPTSNFIVASELREALRKQDSHSPLLQYLDQYFKVIG